MGIKRIAGLAWHRLLMRVDNSTGKGASGMEPIQFSFFTTLPIVTDIPWLHRQVLHRGN